MKRKNHYQFTFICVLLLTSMGYAQQTKTNPNVLVGSWQIDMTPKDLTDTNFAQMQITKVSKNTFKGSFYNTDTPIEKGTINTQSNSLYGALVTGDKSGTYHTSFYYKEGKLYGSTHSLGRNFLAVWIATKKEN